MPDATKILVGLLIFLALATFPVWYDAASGRSSYVPEPELPSQEKRCVESRDYMKTSHMLLLDRWRSQVVRGGDRVYVSCDGRKFDMSLSRTCLGCHASEKKFCARCHDYAGVKIYCWDCHVAPKDPK